MSPCHPRPQRHLLVAVIVLLVVSIAGCRSTPVPTLPPPPTTAVPTDTAVAPTAAAPATATVTAAEASTATTSPPATATPEPEPTVAIVAQTPGEDWVVKSLKVGAGRTYAFLVATEPGQAAGDYHLLYTDDDGETWAAFPGGLPPVSCVTRVDLDYANRDALFAGGCDSGLFRWNGSAWELLSPQRVGAVEVVYQQSDNVWAVDPAAGPDEGKVYQSSDGGQNFTRADAGIGADAVTALGIDPRDGGTLYTLGADLYQGTPDGTWQAVPTRSIMSGVLTGFAIEGGNGALYVSETGTAGRIWRSENANAPDVQTIRWGVVQEFEDQAVQLLATGPSPSGLALYANLADTEAVEGGIAVGDWLPYRSLDGGNTWERIVIPGWIE